MSDAPFSANCLTTPTPYSLEAVKSILASAGHVVIHTSGSTGTPKAVLLSASALMASAASADRALDGPGQWLLALPTDHIAGVNVLARSALAGTHPVTLDRSVPFSASGFLLATSRLVHPTCYVSLVPTQLHRLISPDAYGHDSRTSGALQDEVLDALRGYAGVLVGGAAIPAPLLDRARDAGIKIVTTYGMSETAGGCVYNGKPLDIAQVRTDSSDRVWLSGPMLADGYISDTELENLPAFPSSNLPCTTTHPLREDPAFVTDESGMRWHRTNDLGHLDPQSGQLNILGRADDVILSGGLNIVPSRIESALTGQYGIGQACVVGVPDPHWGHKVVAVVTQSGARLAPVDQIRTELNATLGKGYGPRAFLTVDQLPLTDSGKPDRRQAERIAQAMTANQPARSLRK